MKQQLQLWDKTANIFVYPKMSKTDWNNLERHNIVKSTEKHGNGFSNTTEKFDNKFNISPSYWNFIKIGCKIYGVKYESGCFYPIWVRVYNFENMDKYVKDIKTL